MKYLLIVSFLASIASLEFFHVLSSDDALGAPVCMGSEGKAEAVRDTLLVHLKSH